MLYSMTGFGRAVVEIPGKKIQVEIKSLNSKQMDLTVRIPSALRGAEVDVRAAVSAALQRGKVDVSILLDNTSAEGVAKFHTDAMASYKQQITHAAEMLQIPVPEDWWSVLLRFPDVVTNDAGAEASADERAALMRGVAEAIKACTAHRRAEGEKLEAFFALRIARIAQHLKSIDPYEHERVEHIRARIADSLAKLQDVDYDKNRFEQEMIFYIEKLDVNEEKQRLAQHLAYFTETMALPEGGQGKKLGFIAQEMGREINTLGSKSNHAMMQKIVVMMKDELEQIKEQVLNVM